MGFLGRRGAGERSRCLPLVGLASNLPISILATMLLIQVTLVPHKPTSSMPAEDSTAPSSAPIQSVAVPPTSPHQHFALQKWSAVVLSSTRLGSRLRASPSIRVLSSSVRSVADIGDAQIYVDKTTLTYYNQPHSRGDLDL